MKKLNIVTDSLINNTRKHPGRLGAAASHIKLLMYIKEKEFFQDEWFLILEDDIGIKTGFIDHIENNIDSFINMNAKYVKLFCDNNHFKKNQYSDKNYIRENIYKMIPQWGMLAYLINKDGINYILNNLPLNKTIDDWFVYKHLKNLNAIIYKNDYITNEGAKGPGDFKSKFGSLLITNIRKKYYPNI